MSIKVLEVNNLKRSYSPLIYRMAKGLKITAIMNLLKSKVRIAVDDITFSVDGGEICGFLGPNGAGKTTTIKVIAGLIHSDKGQVKICGNLNNHKRTDTLNLLGGVIETPEMYKNLSGRDNLNYYATLRGGISKERIDEVLKIVGIFDRANDKFSAYSMGMKQRLGIAQAIMHKPKLLLLDEPANGLDPQGIIDLRKLLKKLSHEDGMAILVSSHQLSEMQMICDRVIIMNKGKIVVEKKVEELLVTSDGKVKVTFTADKADEAIQLLKKVYDVIAEKENDKIIVELPKEKVPEATKELLLNGIMISGVLIHENTLEDLFGELTGGGKK